MCENKKGRIGGGASVLVEILNVEIWQIDGTVKSTWNVVMLIIKYNFQYYKLTIFSDTGLNGLSPASFSLFSYFHQLTVNTCSV